MITKEEINILITKAKKVYSKKTVLFWLKTAFGNYNNKEFLQLRKMKFFINLLEGFEIVGEPHQCNCCIEGTYNAELIKDVPSSVAQFQFNDNYRGYMYFNEVGYPFSYSYTTQNKLVIKFDLETMANIECDDLLFTSTCSLSNDNETDSPLNESIFEVTNPAIENPLYLSSLAILDDEEAFIYNMVIPNAIKNDPEAIVELWNTTYGYTGFIANYIDNQYVFYSSIENNYYGWYTRLSQYEGGVDAFAYFEDIMQGQPFITSPSGDSTIGRFRIELYDPSDVYVAALYVDSVNTNYASLEEFVTNFNNSTTNMNFVASTDGTNLTITSPEYSYDTYDAYKITFNYNYVNPIYTDINTVEDLKSGELPTLTEYQDMFTTLGVLGDFVNQKPCDNSVVELTCLTNDNIEKIYNALKTML